MRLTVLKVFSHMILLDPANNPTAQADSVASSIPQGRSLEKRRPLPKVSQQCRDRKAELLTPRLVLFLPLNHNQEKKKKDATG